MQRAGSIGEYRARIAAFAVACLAMVLLPLPGAAQTAAGTLDRVRQTGRLTFGYRTDARPFSYRDESGNPAGYSVMLCQRIAEQVKAEVKPAALLVEWVPVSLEDRFRAVQDGKVDLLCGADTETLERRKDVSFSIPIFPGGIGALLRADSPDQLRQVLSEGPIRPSRPIWRGSPAQILGQRSFSVVARTTSESWLAGRLDKFKISATVTPVDGYAAGVRRVLDRRSDILFGDRAILLDAAKRSQSAGDLIVLDRLFTYEPIALGLRRGDEDMRLVVDRTLSRVLASAEFRDVYAKSFGMPDESMLAFFRTSALPD